MAAEALQERLRSTQVDVFAANPGLTATALISKIDTAHYWTGAIIWLQAKLFGQSVERGARDLIFACLAPQLAGLGFRYFTPNYLTMTGHCTPRAPSNRQFTHENNRRLLDGALEVLREATGDGALSVEAAVAKGRGAASAASAAVAAPMGAF